MLQEIAVCIKEKQSQAEQNVPCRREKITSTFTDKASSVSSDLKLKTIYCKHRAIDS